MRVLKDPDELGHHIIRTYHNLRWGLALLALGLPWVIFYRWASLRRGSLEGINERILSRVASGRLVRRHPCGGRGCSLPLPRVLERRESGAKRRGLACRWHCCIPVAVAGEDASRNLRRFILCIHYLRMHCAGKGHVVSHQDRRETRLVPALVQSVRILHGDFPGAGGYLQLDYRHVALVHLLVGVLWHIRLCGVLAFEEPRDS